jgi:hypothetical protein
VHGHALRPQPLRHLRGLPRVISGTDKISGLHIWRTSLSQAPRRVQLTGSSATVTVVELSAVLVDRSLRLGSSQAFG